ncbi:FKBP-type peptidyl-prolyl cis-trans isomerase [Sphingobacterium sp. BIGb0165]|uniref:FKBP-type peptidyl-prolyl cis-trans isomerase n=1 Tax=Sphingobacterium sp. BIGb0165 TaxID=2940615 RepID=UPI002169F2F3|nr:hypothetical protein [Sphingobacterium sp. BIGb0165]MCS4225117.1 hypothetical protein [Sphingobacterium sp. BIGb0165]
MKNITKFLMALLCLGMIFTSCNKDNFDWDAYYRQQEEAIKREKARQDSLYKIQGPLLLEYAKQNFKNDAGQPNYVVDDSTKIVYQILNPGDKTSYTYKAQIGNGGYVITSPSATINFKGQLLNGTVFDQSKEGTPTNYSNLSPAIKKYGGSWYYAFIPKVISQDGRELKFNGLTTTGLVKGSKIRFVAPSYLGFDQTEYKDGSEKVTVSKDTPVVYTIEITAIGAATSN